MNNTEQLNSEGVMDEFVEYPNVILLQALVDTTVDGAIGELNIDGLQRYQIINDIPNIETKQVSIISSGAQTTFVPVQLGIKLDAPAPTGNVKAKTWVPDDEKSKLQKIERRVKRVVPGSSDTSRLKRDVNNYNSERLSVRKVGGNSALTPGSNKESIATRLKHLIQIHDKPAQPRAFAVLPDELRYRRGLVSPRRALPALVRFGPVQGIGESISAASVQELVTIMRGSPLFLHTCEHDNSVKHINVMDQDKSNWMGLLPLGDEKTANVWIHQYDNELYGVTLKPIPASTPLRLGYSKAYAQMYEIKGQPTMDIFAELPSVQPSHWCKECSLLFPSQRHLELHHGRHHVPRPAGAYRCTLCAMRFTRRYALRRHQRLNCKKTKENTSQIITSETKSQKPLTQNGGFGSQQNGADDSNRLPSDESLQNYTNILDISTNLFDTDRMPNLDISGSVKSDNDFNPLAFKDDSHLANDFSFANGLMDDLVVGDPPQDAKKSPSKVRSSSPFSCPYCKIDMPRSKLKQHSKNCLAQRYECVCGRKYRMKGKMEAHIRTCDIVKDSKTSDNPYFCSECNMTFKRRGMYVNHVTTRHGAAAVPEPPLVVPDRRYPCPDCSKLYKTQAKRHAHVLTQHPGLTYDHSKRLVCGSKSVQPAKCWACPKQYVTRSKLLQHARARHPDTEPPFVGTKTEENKINVSTKAKY